MRCVFIDGGVVRLFVSGDAVHVAVPVGTWSRIDRVIRLRGHRLDDGKEVRSAALITCTCPSVAVPVRQ